MSVDIYGLNPKRTVPEPKVPHNYDDMSEEEKHTFWTMHEHWKQDSPGYRYSSSNWDWRPIQVMIERFNDTYAIGIPEEEIKTLQYNNNKGVSDPHHCALLAVVFNQLLKNMQEKDHKEIFMCTGDWYVRTINQAGHLARYKINDKSVIQKLDDTVDAGFFYELPVLEEVEYIPAYSTTIRQLEEFAAFLDNCNGFRIM
jgi:hypothetical protein